MAYEGGTAGTPGEREGKRRVKILEDPPFPSLPGMSFKSRKVTIGIYKDGPTGFMRPPGEPKKENRQEENRMEQGHMGMQNVDPIMMAIWNKADDATKKMWTLRMLDGKIMMKEAMVKHLQHKLETIKMLKGKIERM